MGLASWWKRWWSPLRPPSLAGWWRRRKAHAVRAMAPEFAFEYHEPSVAEQIEAHRERNPFHLPIVRPAHEKNTRFLVEHIRPDGTTDHLPTNDGAEALRKWEEHLASPRKGRFIFHDAMHPSGNRGVYHRN